MSDLHPFTADADEPEAIRPTSGSGPVLPAPMADPALAKHKQIAGWGGAAGECGVECACRMIFDGFDTLAGALEQLDQHIRDEDRVARKTPDEWQIEMPDVQILDADGWRGVDGRPWGDPISRAEYLRRRGVCTVMGLAHDALGDGCRESGPHAPHRYAVGMGETRQCPGQPADLHRAYEKFPPGTRVKLLAREGDEEFYVNAYAVHRDEYEIKSVESGGSGTWSGSGWAKPDRITRVTVEPAAEVWPAPGSREETLLDQWNQDLRDRAQKRAGLISGLRELADWYEARPEVPLPPFPDFKHIVLAGTDSAGVVELSAVAGALGVEIVKATGDHFRAERHFGGVRFSAYYVSREDSHRYADDQALLRRTKAELDSAQGQALLRRGPGHRDAGDGQGTRMDAGAAVPPSVAAPAVAFDPAMSAGSFPRYGHPCIDVPPGVRVLADPDFGQAKRAS